MDVREKLVELLHKGVRCPGVIDNCGDCPHHSLQNPCDEFGATVDMLIAHGVAVQEWISVKDRLPDLELVEAKANDWDLYPCLATIKNDRAKDGRYVGKAWYDGKGFMDADCVDITYEVTHWMPLPEAPTTCHMTSKQPPKGE